MNKCQREDCGNRAKVKFCSRSCSAKVNNSKHPKRPRPNGYDPNRICGECGAKVNSGYSLFCSISCSSKNKEKEKLRAWLDEEWVPISEYSVPKIIRQYLLDEVGNRCSSSTCCVPGGWSVLNPSTGKVPLTIDHIDGNAKNNSKENLRVLCPNCHSLTETFGSLNKGNGRTYRYSR